MTTVKKIAVSGILLVVLVGVIFGVHFMGKRKPSETSLQVFPGITEDRIGAVLIKDVRDWVKIVRKGPHSWFIVPKQVLQAEEQGSARPSYLFPLNFPVDSFAYSAMLRGIVNLRKDNLVSENPKKQAAYEVDTVLGSRVEIFDTAGLSIGVIYFGISGPGDNGVFIRESNSNFVYLVPNVSRYDFASPHDRWPEKQMTKFDKASIRSIKLSAKGKDELVMEKGEATHPGGWYIAKPVKKPADSEKMNTLLVYTSSLMAWDVADSALTDDITGLADPSVTITVGFKDGSSRQFMFGNVKPGPAEMGNVYNVWAKIPEAPWVFMTKTYDRDQFIKKYTDFELVRR